MELESNNAWMDIDNEADINDEKLADIQFNIANLDIRSLVGRIDDEDIVIPNIYQNYKEDSIDVFQRNFVWTQKQQDQFIESILSGYPIPGIFLVRTSENRYLVLDGQQRLTSIRRFVNDDFSLKNVSKKYRGMSYKTLDSSTRRAFNNYNIITTVIRTLPVDGNQKVIYQLFKRINADGTTLNKHEIRVASFTGEHVRLISKFNAENEKWRYLFSNNKQEVPNVDRRLKDHELVSRILAFYGDLDAYGNSVADFLDNFYEKLSEGDGKCFDISTDLELLNKSLGVIHDHGKPDIFYPQGQRNESWIDALVVGLMRATNKIGPELTSRNFGENYNKFHNFFIKEEIYNRYFGRRSADHDRTLERFEISEKIFSQ